MQIIVNEEEKIKNLCFWLPALKKKIDMQNKYLASTFLFLSYSRMHCVACWFSQNNNIAKILDAKQAYYYLFLKNWSQGTLKEFFSGTKSRNCLQKESIESKRGHISNTEKLVVFDLQTLPLSAWNFATEFLLLAENSLLPWKKKKRK